ncbi:hypothetical protein McaMca56_007939 [Microsporum canis]
MEEIEFRRVSNTTEIGKFETSKEGGQKTSTRTPLRYPNYSKMAEEYMQQTGWDTLSSRSLNMTGGLYSGGGQSQISTQHDPRTQNQQEKVIEDLTAKFEALALPIERLAQLEKGSLGQTQSEALNPATQGARAGVRVAQEANSSRGSGCYYCGERDHFQPRCRYLKQDLEQGLCHFCSTTGKRRIGTPDKGLDLVPRKPGMSQMMVVRTITEQERKLYNPNQRNSGARNQGTASFPQNQTAAGSQGTYDHNPVSSQDARVNCITMGNFWEEEQGVRPEIDSDFEEIERGELATAEVNAAFRVPNSAGQKRYVKEKELPAVKSTKTTPYTILKRDRKEESAEFASLNQTDPDADKPSIKPRAKKVAFSSNFDGDIEMSDAQEEGKDEEIGKRFKGVEHRKLAVELKNSTNIEEILDRIFDQPVNHITIRELIGVSPGLLKYMFLGIPKSAIASAGSSREQISEEDPKKAKRAEASVHSYRVVEAENQQARDLSELRSYPVQTPKTKKEEDRVISVNAMIFKPRIKGYIVPVLYDTGAEINVITRKAAEKLDLPIIPNFLIDIVFLSEEKLTCSGICLDVPISIGDITISSTFLVIEDGGYDLIIGRPFQQVARLGHEIAKNGDVRGHIYSRDGKIRIDFPIFREEEGAVKHHSDLVSKIRSLKQKN